VTSGETIWGWMSMTGMLVHAVPANQSRIDGDEQGARAIWS
jgi:hypothetical protein